ncbi:MAG: hypothetical protein Q9219_003776 [cf. Caloplaca sp. 3 TL-2023]
MEVDVFICGAGPVGLILAVQLRRMGIAIYLVEQTPKSDETKYGRAGALSPRTMEHLDQLGLADPILQQCFVCKGTATFKEGQRVHGGGWDFVTKISDTTFNYISHLRQRYTETVFWEALERYGGTVHEGCRLVNFSMTEERQVQPSRYTVTLRDSDGTTNVVYARYIVGADGSKSTVRKNAGIEFKGSSTPLRWVRTDVVAITNMPDSRVGPVSIQTPEHGNVLWAPMDRGRTRIGFPFTAKMQEQYGNDVKQSDIEFEAAEALKPFSLKIEVVDWWTIYSVGHRLAQHYFMGEVPHDSTWSEELREQATYTNGVFLVGDAAHTHSSGTAQGMNTGIQDATNLAWKLAGVIQGWYRPELLSSYESERRPIAEEIIKLDQDISSLMSNKLPENYVGTQADVNEIFGERLDRNARLTTGLSVGYKICGPLNRPHETGCVSAGQRAPEVLLRKPGSLDPVRLYSLMQNTGRFWIILFHGEEWSALQRSTSQGRPGSLSCIKGFEATGKFITIIAGQALSVYDALGGSEPVGNAYFDVDHAAYERYGLEPCSGGVVVVRPDGYLGYACPLGRTGNLAEYFGAFT